jgi:toxin ParE1/3/4
MARRRWRVRVSTSAERDFIAILDWTVDTFGRRQAQIYRRTLLSALSAVASDPYVPDSQARDAIRPGIRSLHVARNGRHGRHVVLYQADVSGIIDVLRILHDSMDLPRHVPE